MSRPDLCAAQSYLAAQNRHWPPELRAVPRDQWPPHEQPGLFALWRSRGFLVQGFNEAAGVIRISVNRTSLDTKTGRWVDGITWDELQRLKGEAGYADLFAVEIYPAESDVVNVGNLRHLWLLPEPPAFAWRR